MKAMVLTGYNRPLEYQTVEDPKPGDNDIILRVRAAGMCSTDVKIITGKLASFIELPHIPGHEIAGDIVETGKNVKNLRIGQCGVAYPVVTCGRCIYCLTGNENLCINTKRLGFELKGGFSEYVRVPAANFCVCNSEQSFKKMAILSDAVGTPYHAFIRIARPLPGRPVLILGAGGLGLHAVQLAKMMGAMVIVCDIKDEALAVAEKCGADLCLNTGKSGDVVQKILEVTGGIGVDIALEGVGRQETVSLALGCLKKQGTMIVMGYNPGIDITIPFIDVHNKELKIAGTKICTRQDLIEVIKLVEEGHLIPEVSETTSLDNLNEALDAVQSGRLIGRMCIEN